MGGCGQCAKPCVLAWSVIYMLCGVALMGLGTWIQTADDYFNAAVMLRDGLVSSLLPWRGVIASVICLGGFCVIVGAVGVWGATTHSHKILYNIHISFGVLSGIAILGTAIFSGVICYYHFKHIEPDDSTALFTKLRENINRFYQDDNATAARFEHAWNDFQVKHRCCGVEPRGGHLDYESSPLSLTPDKYVPWSCCRLLEGADRGQAGISDVSNYTWCQTEASWGIDPGYYQYDELYNQGCGYIHTDVMYRASFVSMVMGFTLTLIQIVSLIAIVINIFYFNYYFK